MSSQDPKPARRSRKTRNCEPCRSSKLKCDRGRPCSSCVLRGHASHCHSPDDPEASTSRDNVSIPINPSSEFKKIRQSLALLEARLQRDAPSSPDPRVALVPLSQEATMPADAPPEQSFRTPKPTWPHRSNLLTGPTHWMSYLDAVGSPAADNSSEYGDAMAKDMSPEMMLERYERDNDLIDQLPSTEVIDSLVDYYFEHSNWVYRYVHEPAFAVRWAGYKSGDYPSRLLLATVCALMAIALCHLPDGHAILDGLSDSCVELSSRYYHVMQDFLAREPMDSSQYSLGTVELLLAQCHYLTLTQVESEELWCIKGRLVSIAIALGLHRDPVDDSIPELNERRRWAWWNVLCIDRCQAFIFGRPLSIESHQFNTRLPHSVDTSSDKGRVHVGPISFLRLCHLVGEFMSDATSLHSVPYGTILDKDNLLQEWFDTLSPELSLNDQSLGRSLSSSIPSIRRFAIQAFVLRAQLLHARFALHHAASASLQQDSPEKTTSMTIAIEAASKLLSLALHIQPQGLGGASTSVIAYLCMIPYHVLSAALFLAVLLLERPFEPSFQSFRHNIEDAVTVLERFAGKPYVDKALSILRLIKPLCSEMATLESTQELQMRKADAFTQIKALTFPDHSTAITRLSSFAPTPMSMTSRTSSPFISMPGSSNISPSIPWTAFGVAGSAGPTMNDAGNAGTMATMQRRIRSDSDLLNLGGFGLGYPAGGIDALNPSSDFPFGLEEAQEQETAAAVSEYGSDFVWPGDSMGYLGQFSF